MLPKENRLTTRFEYSVAKKYGTRIYSPYFAGYVVKPTNYEGPVKVGIVVANIVHKKAAKRNVIKRAFREAIRARLNQMGKNVWWAFYPKVVCLGADYDKIGAELDKALQKVSIPH